MGNQICKYVIGVKQNPGSNSHVRDEMCEKMLCLLWFCVRWSEVMKNNSNSWELNISHCGVTYDILVKESLRTELLNSGLGCSLQFSVVT